MLWRQLILLAAAGALGTLSRFGVYVVMQRIAGDRFPWGTLTVNLLGSFLFGLVWTLAEEQLLISPQTRLVLLTGFMGAFTTFSTFAFETSALLHDAEYRHAFGNVLGQNVLGVAAVFLGFAAGRLFSSAP